MGCHADNGGKYTTKRNNRLIDGEKEESFSGRLSRAEDEADNGDKNVAKMHNERGAHECARRNAIDIGGRRFLSAKIGRIQEKTPNGRKRTKENPPLYGREGDLGCRIIRRKKQTLFYLLTGEGVSVSAAEEEDLTVTEEFLYFI